MAQIEVSILKMIVFNMMIGLLLTAGIKELYVLNPAENIQNLTNEMIGMTQNDKSINIENYNQQNVVGAKKALTQTKGEEGSLLNQIQDGIAYVFEMVIDVAKIIGWLTILIAQGLISPIVLSTTSTTQNLMIKLIYQLLAVFIFALNATLIIQTVKAIQNKTG